MFQMKLKNTNRTICPHCLEEYARINKKTAKEVLKEVADKLRYAKDPREVYEQYWFESDKKVRREKVCNLLTAFLVRTIFLRIQCTISGLRNSNANPVEQKCHSFVDICLRRQEMAMGLI